MGYETPQTQLRRGSNRRNKSGQKGSNSVDSLIVASHHNSGKAFLNFPASDLRSKVPSFQLIERPPKNFMTMIHWIQSTYSGNYNVSSSTITESNLSFSLNSLNAYNSWVALFDQYCIYSAHVRLSIIGEGYTTALGTLATAIDYDSTGNLGTYVGIQDYSSVQVNTVEVGMSYERFIKPCVAPAIYNATSSAFSGFGVSRMWVDCVNSGVPHYGFRAIWNGNASTVVATYTVTLTLGFRNNI